MGVLSEVANQKQYKQNYNDRVYHWKSPLSSLSKATWTWLPGFEQIAVLQEPQQVQNNEDDYDDEQRMDDISRAGNAGKDVRSEVAEQPKHEQDDDDPGKHEISPFE